MLEHRESQMRYLIQRVVENTPSNCGDGPFDPHQTVPVDTSACDSLRYKHWHSNPLLKLREVRNDREEPELFSTQRQCNNTKFELENPREDCTQGRKRNSNYCPPKSVCGCLSSKKRYDVMKLVDQIESTCILSCDFLNHRRSRRCSEDARKHKKDDEKELLRNSSNAEASTAKLIPDYISGDSELTAERMAEGNSRTGSFEDGCTLILDNVATAAESVTKDSTTPDRQAIDDISFSFSPQGCSDQLRQQRDSRNSDYVRQARQSSFQSLTISADHVNPCSTGITEQSVKDDSLAASAASRQVSYNRMGIEEEESWLQLCLGDSYSQPARLNGTPWNMKGAECTEPESARTLQLLPRKSENDSSRLREIEVKPVEQNERHFTINEPGHHRFRSFMDPSTSYRQDISGVNPESRIEESSYTVDFRQIQGKSHSLLPHRSFSYRPSSLVSGLPGQTERSCSLTTLNGDHKRPHAMKLVGEESESAVALGISTVKIPFRPYELPSPSQCFGFSSPSKYTENCPENINACPSSALSVTPRYRNQEYIWQSPYASNNTLSWSGFQGGLNTRMRNYDEVGLDIDQGGTALQSHISFQSGHTSSNDRQDMVETFGTNLHFHNAEKDFSLVGSKISTGNLLPVQKMTVFPQTVEGVQSNRLYNRDKRNIAIASVAPLNTPTMDGTLLSNNSEMRGRRMLSVVLDNRKRAKSQSDLPRTLFSRNPQVDSETLISLGQQTISPSFPAERIRVTKTSRVQPDIWFSLQAAENMSGDQELPQLPQAYLRIRDGQMTISLVQKYLATKLGLPTYSQVDIACRGQLVLPTVSLQHVRDTIWFPRKHQHGENSSFTSWGSSCSSSKEYIMVLTYQRRAEMTPTN